MKLTQDAVTRVKRNAAGADDYIEWDDALKGFGLRVRAGSCSWVVQYKIGPRHRRIKLGSTDELTADEARNGWKDEKGDKRDGAAKILVAARDGFDAVVSRAKRRTEASKTLGNIVAAYLEAKKPEFRPRGYQAAEYHLNTLWKPLHGLPVSAVNRPAIAAQVRTIAKESGDVSANRARGTMSAMFRWAIGEGSCDENPVVGTNKLDENDPRERILIKPGEKEIDDWSEAAAVWRAAPDNDYGRIVQLLILTGSRRDEIGSLQWPEIDLEARTITLPPDRTKNGKEHVVPLCDAAVAILKEKEKTRPEGRDFVFGAGEGGYSGWSKSKVALDKTAKLKEPWTLHDLRRTVRTGLGMLGTLPHVAEAALNHLPPKLIRTYDRNTYAAEKRAALDLWAGHLAVAVAQASGANVARLPTKKKTK
jgi:integrase